MPTTHMNPQSDILPLVSVVLPTYKRPQLIAQAVKSVQQQTYEHWELIIVDDNGADTEYAKETQAIVSSIATSHSIHYVQQPINKGACAARNKGIEQAQGKYIAFLDDDDSWEPEKIEKQVLALEKNQADVCYCDMYLTYQEQSRYFAHRICQNTYDTLLNRGFGICTSALLVSKQALNSINGFDNELPSMQDYDLLIRLAEKHSVVEIPEPLLTYARADDGITMNLAHKIRGHQAILKKYKSVYLARGLVGGISRQYESIADFNLRSGHRIAAIKYYLNGLKHQVRNRRLWIKLMVGGLLGGQPLERFLKRRDKKSKHIVAK